MSAKRLILQVELVIGLLFFSEMKTVMFHVMVLLASMQF